MLITITEEIAQTGLFNKIINVFLLAEQLFS